MKKNLLYLIVLSLFLVSCSGKSEADLGLIPFIKDNAEQSVVYLNTKGEEVVKAPKDLAGFTLFYDDLALVIPEKSYGDGMYYYVYSYIDKSGNLVWDNAEFKAATTPSEGVVWTVSDEGYPLARNHKGEIHLDSEVIRGAIRVNNFSDGLAAYSVSTSDDEILWGYINKKGEVVIEPQFADAESFKNGIALVRHSGGKYGYINKKNGTVVEPQFGWATSFVDGYAIVSMTKNGPKGVINQNGRFVVAPQYKEIYHDGTHFMVERDGLFGWIDREGVEFIRPQYKVAQQFFDRSYTTVSYDKDKVFIIDKKGKLESKSEYDNVIPLTDKLMLFWLGDLVGMVDRGGTIVANPQFKEVGRDLLLNMSGMESAAYVETDFFDVERVVDAFFDESNSNNFRGISAMNYGQVKEEFGDHFGLPYYDELRVDGDKWLGQYKVRDGGMRLVFSQQLRNYDYNFGGYIDNNSARLVAVQHMIDIDMGAVGYMREQELEEAVVAKLLEVYPGSRKSITGDVLTVTTPKFEFEIYSDSGELLVIQRFDSTNVVESESDNDTDNDENNENNEIEEE